MLGRILTVGKVLVGLGIMGALFLARFSDDAARTVMKVGKSADVSPGFKGGKFVLDGANVLGLQAPEGDASLCPSSPFCGSHGYCTGREDLCVVGGDDDCAGSLACRVHGQCSAQGNRCIAANDADCHDSYACSRSGLCTAKSERCTAIGDDDCAESLACLMRGQCAARAGECIATAETCKTACMGLGPCHLRDGQCVGARSN